MSTPALTPPYDLIALIGPTASGKTRLAARLAATWGAEIVGADSRQVYRRMDVGTGKDLADYHVEGRTVPYHLIDIVEPGTKYNLYRYQADFLPVYHDIRRRGARVLLCGGSGLYVESIVRGYRLSPVEQNPALRERLRGKSLAELTALLATYKHLHNTTDVDSPARAIRAIEIAEHYRTNPIPDRPFPHLHSLVLGLAPDRDTRRRRITERLHRRMREGMDQEVRALLAEGIAPDDLIYYGLEYKYVTLYVLGRLTKDEMLAQLEIAIHQFAKRQMTWFRGMERRGIPIHWLSEPPAEGEPLAPYLERNGLAGL